jgi:hypothetical protein
VLFDLREVGLGRGAVSGVELAYSAGTAGVPPAALVVQGSIASCLLPVACAQSPRYAIPMGESQFKLKSNVLS